MEPKSNHNQHPAKAGDHRLASLGIHLSESPADSPCPDEQEMARLIDKAALDDPLYASFFEHLAQCEDCYQCWVSVSSVQQDSFADKLLKHLKRPRSLSIIGTTLVAAATVILVFQLPSKDELHMQLSTPQAEPGYEMMQDSGLNSKSLPPEREAQLTAPAETAAPVPMMKQLEETDGDSGFVEKKEKRNIALQRSVSSAAADSTLSFSAVTDQILLFCEQSSFDEERRLQLLNQTSSLLNENLNNFELKEIKDILTKMTASTKPQHCDQIQSIVKK